MKKNLLFLLLILLVQFGGNETRAQGSADETYNFADLASSNGSITYGASYPSGKGITNGAYWESIGSTPMFGRFADRSASDRGWWLRNSTGQTVGLWIKGTNLSPELAICNLHEGDRIRITFSGGGLDFVSTNAAINGVNVNENDHLTSGLLYSATNNGDIVITGTSNYTVITKVEIFYSSNKYYNFEGVQNQEKKPGGTSANIDGHDGYKLDFVSPLDGSSYDGSFNHPDNFRFFVYQQGWKVDNSGLRYTGTEDYSDFYITDIKKNDRVTLTFNDTSLPSGQYVGKFYSPSTSGIEWDTPITNGTEYAMVNDGTLHLAINKNVSIKSIQVKSVEFRFSKLTDTYNLVNLSYTEPTLIGASGLTVTYTGNNPKVAIPDSNTGDLMIVNTGEVTITATATVNGVNYSASYTLTVMAAEAVWSVRNGNECYFPEKNPSPDAATNNNNTGKLLLRKVTSVPYITMEFGNADNENLAMVTFRHDQRAANLIDQNGWQHIWMNHTQDFLLEPYQGSFYKFQPAISGKLTIKGVRNHNGKGANTVVLVDKNADATNDWATDVNIGRRTSVKDNSSTYYSYPIVKPLNFADDNTFVATEEQIDLIGGHTYYLYANTPATRDKSLSENWQCFYLSGFKYETTFNFEHQNVVMGATGVQADGYYHIEAATSYRQTINNETTANPNISYSIVCKGNITANIDANTGQLSNISGNGAIVVTATLTEGSSSSKTSYVLTVPYTTIANGGSKRWVFNQEDYSYNSGSPTGTNMMEQLEQLKTNAPAEEWTIKYKVRQYNATTKALEYINVPVLANALDVVGDNARYIGTTEGLLFNANANSFGTTTGVRDDNYRTFTDEDKKNHVQKKENGDWIELTEAGDIDLALKAMLNYNANDAAGTCYYLTLENGNSMTIPNLKAGQHIRIKWSRYSKNHGDKVTVYNVTDLNGTDMNAKEMTVGAGGNVDRNGGTGYHEFIVKDNGDVTFTVAQNGWVNIYEIMVDNNFIPTDLKLADGESLIRKKESGNSFSHVYSHKWSDIQCQSNVSVSYSIKNGTRTGTLTPGNCDVTTTGSGEDLHYNLNVGESGHGRFTLVQEGKVGDYVLDRKEIEIKVYEYDYTPQEYPRTWNMENISTATGTALSTESGWTDANGNYRNWTSAGENKYQLTLEPENLISWSTKATVDGPQTTINELNGLGIRPADITRRNNSIVFNNADHSIDITGAATQILTVPNVTNYHFAYIRVKKGTDASVTAKFTANTTTADKELTTVYDDGTYAVYKAEGGGKTTDGNAHIIDFYLKNVSVIQVAVSKNTKTISAAGYATEARDYPVDYTMTKTLTGDEYIAYKITGVGDDKVISTHVEYVQAGAGVMVTGNVTSQATRPIFTTDVNRTASDMSGNLLVGVVTPPAENIDQTTEIDGTTYYNYLLAASGYKVVNENGTPTAKQSVSGLGYYLVYKTGTKLANGNTYTGGKPKANSAYLRLTEVLAKHQELNSGSSNAPRYCFFIGDMNDDEATAIGTVPADSTDIIRGQEGVYYTLQGVRVTTPVKGQVYILNGKKVVIK